MTLLIVATVLAVVGVVVAMVIDLRMPERRRVGRFRDLVEVLLPVVGLLVLVVAVWIAVVAR